MELLEWNAKYELGVSGMDEQHRKLVEMLNALQEAVAAGKGAMELQELFDEILTYTKYHFKWEEDLMNEYDYTGFAEHNAEHEELAHEVLKLQRQLKDGSLKVSFETADALRKWLTEHILVVDKEFADYINSTAAITDGRDKS